MKEKETEILSIRIGKVEPLGDDGRLSAINKRLVSGHIMLTTTGFEGDEHADTRHHGGKEMAVHHYPAEHYQLWIRENPELNKEVFVPGAFGENVSTIGMTEETVFLGDTYRVGQATLQVSQGRQPCGKLNIRFGFPNMAKEVQRTSRSGWYYRVTHPGRISAGEKFCLENRPNPKWPIARLLHFLYEDPMNEDALEEIAHLEELSETWQNIARSRLKTGTVEDWAPRLS